MQRSDETIPIREGEDFDRERLARFLREHISGVPDGPLDVSQFPSGRSNLTYLVRIGEWEAVLRRPPLGPVPPKAHDMEREAAILRKLHAVYPLAPLPFAICSDSSLLGAPFYVMERRRGVVLDATFPLNIQPTSALCREISYLVVDTLVRLHAIDWRAAGLADFGHPEGFLERQVHGWVERYNRAQTDDIPQADPLMRWLERGVPASHDATIIHNDFKLNNMLLDLSGAPRIAGILDWEMSTIGDPLFDLAVSLSYWVTADDPAQLRMLMPTVVSTPGFITREEFMRRYAERSGRDLSTMHFHMTFAYFKLAVIIQQIYARWKRGQTRDERFAGFGAAVRGLIEYAASLAEQERR
jgi:aminoglycoside phosphotransferase (APT) family kinase protein